MTRLAAVAGASLAVSALVGASIGSVAKPRHDDGIQLVDAGTAVGGGVLAGALGAMVGSAAIGWLRDTPPGAQLVLSAAGAKYGAAILGPALLGAWLGGSATN